MGGYVGFGMPSSNVYGGAFNSVPDRVGSAPATDLSIVSVIVINVLEIQYFYSGFTPEQTIARIRRRSQ